jgi:tetratricopeptide (TPR) repeat protein
MAFGHYYESRLLSVEDRYNEAIEECRLCIDGLDSLGIIQTLSFPLMYLGHLFDAAGRPTDKLKYFSDKLIFYKKHGPIENTAQCFHQLANYYSGLPDYDKAIGYYIRARDVFSSFDPYSAENEEECVADCYIQWGNLDKAEEILKSALNELVRLDEIYISYSCYRKLGEVSVRRNDFKEALQYFYTAGLYYWDSLDKAANLVNIGAAHLRLNNPDSAYYYFMAADNIRQQKKYNLTSHRGNLEIDYNLYRYYLATGDKKRAVRYLENALQEARAAGDLPYIMKYSGELYSCLLKEGDSLKCLPYLVEYHLVQDSVDAINTRARIATYEIEEQQQQKENEIGQLQIQKTAQRNYYMLGGAFLLLLLLAGISRFRYKRRRDEEQLKTEFKKQLAKAETVALRAQMNPHFIFNCLNSINSFVIDQDHEKASEYLIKFSKLIRLILDNSRSETISLDKELETLKLYILLESARFDNKFSCEYHIAEEVQTDSVMIPPMLLQPFVENAIWHGLMQKEGSGTITIDITKENEEFLNISITDDGIGRGKAAELKSKSVSHKSHGLKVTSQRIEMMNRLNSTGARVNIFDLKDENGIATGTRVELIIPL